MEKQRDKILAAMQRDPERVWFAKDFQNWEHFVWYEAGTRIGDLVRLGLVEQAGRFGKFMGYRIAGEKEPEAPRTPLVTVTRRTVIVKSPEEYKEALKKAYIAGRKSGWSFLSDAELAQDYISHL